MQGQYAQFATSPHSETVIECHSAACDPLLRDAMAAALTNWLKRCDWRIRHTSSPERACSLPNWHLNLHHKHVRVKPRLYLRRIGGLEEQGQCLDKICAGALQGIALAAMPSSGHRATYPLPSRSMMVVRRPETFVFGVCGLFRGCGHPLPSGAAQFGRQERSKERVKFEFGDRTDRRE